MKVKGATQEKLDKMYEKTLKEPLEILGYSIEVSKIVGAGGQGITKVFEPRVVNTLKDIARLDMDIVSGRFVPVPTIQTQTLMLMLTKLKMIQD